MENPIKSECFDLFEQEYYKRYSWFFDFFIDDIREKLIEKILFCEKNNGINVPLFFKYSKKRETHVMLKSFLNNYYWDRGLLILDYNTCKNLKQKTSKYIKAEYLEFLSLTGEELINKIFGNLEIEEKNKILDYYFDE